MKLGAEMSLEIDNKISLGHVISIVTAFAIGLIGYGNLQAQQTQMAQEVASVVKSGDARETRLRAVEIAQASQTSDLRSIQIGIIEIKAQLNKMQDHKP